MKNYLSKSISNHFLNELLAFENHESIFNEFGSIIDESTLEFIIYTSAENHETILKIAKLTFEDKFRDIYMVLYLKYSLECKIRFVNKRFSYKEIQRFTYHYFIPETTNNKYIFKYAAINKNLKILLKNNSFWFTAPKDFKDITDCKFEIDTEPSKKNILNFYYKKYLQENNDKNGILDASSFEKSFEYPTKKQFNSDLLEHHYNGVFSKLGITCFSEKCDNKLMWDNYADGFKGVCLIFDTTVSGDKYYKIEGRKVRYFKNLPKYFFDGSGYMEVGHIIFSKTMDYEFEKEIREFISFQFEEKIERSIEFNPHALKGIILGARCSDKNKELIKQLVSKRKYKNIELIESNLDRKLKIKIDKHNISLKEKKATANAVQVS
jgi:hypothetical protein